MFLITCLRRMFVYSLPTHTTKCRPFPTASPQDAQSRIPRPTMGQSHLSCWSFPARKWFN
jgi:hypothetical protein